MQPACLARGPRGAWQASWNPHCTLMSSAVAAGGVFLLVILAPFETTAPLVRLPGQALSNLEAALLGACVAWAGAIAWSAATRRTRPTTGLPAMSPVVAAGAIFVIAMGVASLAAPEQRSNAWHMTGRFAAAGAVY